MFGDIIIRRQCGGISVSGVTSGRTEHDHQPIFLVRTGIKFRGFQGHDIPARYTQVQDVLGGGVMVVHS